MRRTLIALIGAMLLFSSELISAQRAKTGASKEKELVGEVISVQPERNQILIKSIENGKHVNRLFTITEESILFTFDPGSDERMPLLLEELEQGHNVVVLYSRSGRKNLIRSLQLDS